MDEVNYNLTMSTSDFLYIASDLPFNHFNLKVGNFSNTATANMKIEYYSSSWIEAVDMIDETNSFKNSGHVEFTPNRNNTWSRVTDSDSIGLTKIVYYKYWSRISFDSAISGEIDFIGGRFSDDVDLFAEYPIFNDNNFMSAFQLGKTNWDEQAAMAASIIYSDLQKKGIIIGKGQVLDRKKFTQASVSKVAEVVFSAFGNDYIEQKNMAKDEYNRRLDLSQYSVDTNENGILEPVDLVARQGWLSR